LSILDDAHTLIHGDRQGDYGHPADDFRRVTRAAAELGVDPHKGPLHHALYMVLVKTARLVETPKHRDSVVDGAGYFGTYEMIIERDYGGWEE
jgi:hypothetical protein